MSGDQRASSFGDPNAQPPTPKQTPSSVVFPSPAFETPKTTQARFDESGGWTPSFAEEYSVFNATPGNLRGSQGPFVDFPPASTQFPPSAGLKRPLSAGGIAAEIATHVNHFSPNPNLPLPPVEPSRRLPSSPTPLAVPQEYSGESDTQDSPRDASQERSAKRARRETLEDIQTQTATPPPSARKGERKLAPKLKASAMQNEQGYGQPDFNGTPQQPNMATFVTTPNDMFGYPLSAPATAPAAFWDPASMAGMDFDFSASSNIFQTPTPVQRQMGSFDWSGDVQTFPNPPPLPPSNQENLQPIRRERPIASKALLPNTQTTTAATAGMTTTYTTPTDDPFGMVSPNGGVDPGLLFSRPQSSSMDTTAFNYMGQPSSSAPLPLGESLQPSKARVRNELRRTSSVKELGSRIERPIVSSPIKPTGRPNLQRSFSENRGKKGLGRLPALAPASRRTPQASGSGVGASRPISSRTSGRTSPLKTHHQRLSSLTSIPEASGPRTRPPAKLTIDAYGRARVESTMTVDEPSPGNLHRRQPSREIPRRDAEWDSSDAESSTDDEPIMLPSQNASFALPDPVKPVPAGFHTSQRSISERSTTSLATFAGEASSASQHADGESEAETVMNEPHDNKGDAASELLKVVEDRQKRASQSKVGPRARMFTGGRRSSHENTISPTTLTDASLPTPSTDAPSRAIRCVCNRNGDGDGFMVQCESCEMWLHGRCTNIPSSQMLPAVYICSFCAETPNRRRGRARDTGRNTMAPSGSASSPLAHKSHKSFR